MMNNTINFSPSYIDPNTRRAITTSVGSKSSSWLTVLPIALHHFDLSAT